MTVPRVLPPPGLFSAPGELRAVSHLVMNLAWVTPPAPSNSSSHGSPCRKELGNRDTGHLYPSVEELKNVWIPYAIKMRLSKSKELDVCNWSESEEVKAPRCRWGRGHVAWGCGSRTERVWARDEDVSAET